VYSAIILLLMISNAIIPQTFFGPLPLWSILSVCSLPFMLRKSLSGGNHVKAIYRNNFKLIIWLFLLPLVILGIDAIHQVDEITRLDSRPLRDFGLGFSGVCLALSLATWINLEKQNFERAILWLGFAGVFVGCLSFAQYMEIPGAWELPDLLSLRSSEEYKFDHRIRGSFATVHQFGPFAATLALFLFLNALNNKITRQRFLLFGAAVGCSFATLLTFSRAAIASLILCVMFSMAVYYRQNKKLLVTILLGVSLLTVAGVLATNIDKSRHWQRLGDTQMRADKDRWLTIKEGLMSGLSSPIIGVPPAEIELPTHNIPANIFQRFGVVGLIFIGWLYYSVYRKTRRLVKNDTSELKIMGLFGLSFLFIQVANGMTHTSGFLFYDYWQWTFFGVLLSFFGKDRIKSE
jgi:hypothetical protein